MIYTDEVHLMSDDLNELHTFAKRIGLKREWFQSNPKHPHYDLLSERMITKAINEGAIRTTSREMLQKCKRNF